MNLSSNENIKYRLRACVNKLHISNDLNFETKVIWKRNVNRAETKIVVNQDSQSIFNQTLELELNLLYDSDLGRFQSKYTEFLIILIYLGQEKNGGSTKFDAAEIVNKNYVGQKIRINLMKCPDPQAYLQLQFNYELMYEVLMKYQQQNQDQIKLSNIKQTIQECFSINQYQSPFQQTNPFQQSNPFQQRKISKIHNILDKFDKFSKKCKNSQVNSQTSLKEDHNQTKNQSLEISMIPNDQEERVKILQARIFDLQKELQNRDQLVYHYQRKLEEKDRYIEELSMKLQIIQAWKQNKLQTIRQQPYLNGVEDQSNFKYLYEKTLNEVEELKEQLESKSNPTQNAMRRKETINELTEIPSLANCQAHQQELEFLERQNIELQTKIASISHNIANLFNAAYEYGGAKLLDYLQNSIGLIE